MLGLKSWEGVPGTDNERSQGLRCVSKCMVCGGVVCGLGKPECGRGEGKAGSRQAAQTGEVLEIRRRNVFLRRPTELLKTGQQRERAHDRG